MSVCEENESVLSDPVRLNEQFHTCIPDARRDGVLAHFLSTIQGKLIHFDSSLEVVSPSMQLCMVVGESVCRSVMQKKTTLNRAVPFYYT